MQEEKFMQEDKLQVLKILSKSIREFKKTPFFVPFWLPEKLFWNV